MRIVFLATPPTVKDSISGKVLPAPGFVPLGGGYYDALDSVDVPAAAVLSSGRKRYGSLPAAHKPKVMLTEVLRSSDTAFPDLKARIMGLVKAEVEARGETLAKYTPAQIRAFVLKKVKDRLAARQETKIVRLRVKMDSVPASDIEDPATIIPHRWLGEPDTEADPPAIPPP